RQSEAGRHERHRHGRAERKEGKRDNRQDVTADRGEEQDADAGGSAHAVHETDAEGAAPAAGPHVCVPVPVAESAAAPPREQQHRQSDDHEPDGRLRGALDGLRQIRAVEHDRQTEDEQRRGVTETPGEAEPRGPARRTLSRRSDQGRDRREVVRVARVAKAEQDRDTDDDQQRRPVREARDLFVEPEHGYRTSGSAWSVIASPATRITSALTAGRRPISPPSKLSREKARFATTATRPMPVIVNARPALNARISRRPNAIRCNEIAASRTTSADGQGRRPPEIPTARSERRLIACSC